LFTNLLIIIEFLHRGRLIVVHHNPRPAGGAAASPGGGGASGISDCVASEKDHFENFLKNDGDHTELRIAPQKAHK